MTLKTASWAEHDTSVVHKISLSGNTTQLWGVKCRLDCQVRKAGGVNYWGTSGLSIGILTEIYSDKEYYNFGLKEFFESTGALSHQISIQSRESSHSYNITAETKQN